MYSLINELAEAYETQEFLNGDPSFFMHQVEGDRNREAIAFVASALSFGSRRQFMKKIAAILEESGGEMDAWVRDGRFATMFCKDDTSCFYRFFTYRTFTLFLEDYRRLMLEHGTLGGYVRKNAKTGFEAVKAICDWFAQGNASGVVPKDVSSACKRVCMFLRWMVRDSSPVDLGLWKDFIDKRTLIIPLDTHVLQESLRLGLTSSHCGTMRNAITISLALQKIFPNDPLKGDFALFGYGIAKRPRQT